MRVAFVHLAALAACLPSQATAADRHSMGTIWQRSGDAIVVVPCPPGGDTDEHCRALAARHDGRLTPIGSGYMSEKLLWAGRDGATAPDAVVLGDSGGSGGFGDIFAVTFGNPIAVSRLRGERIDWATARKGAKDLHLTLAFNIEYFNGASHADGSIVPLPIIWSRGDFAIDLPALTRRPATNLINRESIGRELHTWSREKRAGYMSHSTTETVTALTTLILSGRPDEARMLLHAEWPKAVDGEAAFWHSLCAAIVHHPWWARFKLDRIRGASRVLMASRAQPQL